MTQRLLGVLLLVLFLLPWPATAHEIRPAYLQIDENAPGSYNVLWKMPRTDEMVLDVEPQFDKAFVLAEAVEPVLTDGFVVFRYRLGGKLPLAGTRLVMRGQQQTTIDVLVNLSLQDGSKHTFLLHPKSNTVDIPATPSAWGVARAYLKLGVEHILLGFDHLLFVLALILLTNGLASIVKTVTAFTLAHSITLSLAALGYVHVPGPPVEATIALSIMFLALEILRMQDGKATLTSRKPWLVAFTFGLLHGLGFAGALADIGLPQTEIPLALATFNIGVELGQLAFVAVVLMVMRILGKRDWSRAARKVPVYAIGAVSAFWEIERVFAFVP